jgi:hypothetical protein
LSHDGQRLNAGVPGCGRFNGGGDCTPTCLRGAPDFEIARAMRTQIVMPTANNTNNTAPHASKPHEKPIEDSFRESMRHLAGQCRFEIWNWQLDPAKYKSKNPELLQQNLFASTEGSEKVADFLLDLVRAAHQLDDFLTQEFPKLLPQAMHGHPHSTRRYS